MKPTSSQPNLQPTIPDLSERLTPLSDGRPGVRAALTVQVCSDPASQPESGPIIDFVASSEALDRYDEVIVPAGWRLDNYRRNPVFQNAHQYGDVLFTLGRALLTEVREVAGRMALFQRIEFAVEVNPVARIAYGLYKGKFLNAVSVGFIPVRWENGGAEAGYRRKYLEQELLEVSAVGIPANPEALQLGLKAGAIEKDDLKALLELLRALPETSSFDQNHST
ncbi:MAG: HK97 family phage prohead protease, partial [Limisphaerales bacterium]